MLEQSGKAKLLARKIEGAPKPKRAPKLLILDGQQRATALYQALSGKGSRETTFFVNMEELRREQAVTDECIDALKDKAFKKDYGKDIGENAENGVIRVADLISSSRFNDWLTHVSDQETERRIYADLKDEHLEYLGAYPLRIETVPADLPVEAIAKIFERTNRSVLQLDAFDLMVAILFPHQRFNLREEWEAAKDVHPILSDYSVAGIEVLKVLALREHLRQRDLLDQGKLAKMKVRGVRQDDVLALEAKHVIAEWTKAVAAYANALTFIRDHCGVIRKGVIPQHTMLLPLAACFHDRPRPSAAARGKLTRWFWASVFRREYARGANTRAVTDTRVLRGWLSRGGTEPEEVSNFSIDSHAFAEVDDGNDIVARGGICLLNVLGAQDWAKAAARAGKGRRLVDTPASTSLEIHHVFPLEFLKTRVRRPRVAAEVPANQVLIDASLNHSVRNSAPSTVAHNSKVLNAAIPSHLAELSSMKKDRYEQFIKQRSEALARAARRAVTP